MTNNESQSNLDAIVAEHEAAFEVYKAAKTESEVEAAMAVVREIEARMAAVSDEMTLSVSNPASMKWLAEIAPNCVSKS